MCWNIDVGKHLDTSSSLTDMLFFCLIRILKLLELHIKINQPYKYRVYVRTCCILKSCLMLFQILFPFQYLHEYTYSVHPPISMLPSKMKATVPAPAGWGNEMVMPIYQRHSICETNPRPYGQGWLAYPTALSGR